MEAETQTPQAAFDRAVSEFNSGNLDRAKILFESIRESGVSSPDLEINLSKVYFKLGKPYQALTHGQTGVLLKRVDSRARNDLTLMQKSIPGGYGEVMDDPSEYSWKIYSYVRPAEAALGSAFLFFLFFLGAILRRSLWTRASILNFSLAALLGLAAVATRPAKSLALVKEDGAELRSAPIESAESTAKLPPGTRLKIRQTRGDFVEVERPSGFRGWVAKSKISTLL